jgi:hypothetical protein
MNEMYGSSEFFDNLNLTKSQARKNEPYNKIIHCYGVSGMRRASVATRVAWFEAISSARDFI